MIYADLHCHSNYSDGILDIKELLLLAKEKGIHVLALTDHDTLFHYEKAKRIAKELDIEIIKGVEMSCYDFDVHKKIHLIGLWLNDHAEHVEKLCRHTLECRDKYHRELICQLNKKGYEISYEDAKKYSPYNIVFKMNIFQALQEKYKDEMTKEKYIELFASQTSVETDSKMGYIDIQEGIDAIKKDGGVAIIAHPCEYDNYDEIEKYVEYGLQGIEINHPSITEKDSDKTKGIAQKFHLIQSGGSDFHSPLLTKMGENGLTKEEYNILKKEVEIIRMTKNIRNFRDVSGYTNKYGETLKKNMIFRGASLDKIDHDTVDFLEKELNIRYIIDYRSHSEKRASPNQRFSHAQYIQAPVLDESIEIYQGFDFHQLIQGKINKDNIRQLYDFLLDQYKKFPFAIKAYKQLFDCLLNCDGGVYFHCSAGKDRTGISAFLAMIALGMKEEDCIQEYLLSNALIYRYNEEVLKLMHCDDELKDLYKKLLYVEKQYLLNAIQSIKEKYSSYDEFLLKEYGLDENKRLKLRNYYCIKKRP